MGISFMDAVREITADAANIRERLEWAEREAAAYAEKMGEYSDYSEEADGAENAGKRFREALSRLDEMIALLKNE